MVRQVAWRAFQLLAFIFFYVMCLQAADALTGEAQHGLGAIAIMMMVTFALVRSVSWLIAIGLDRLYYR